MSPANVTFGRLFQKELSSMFETTRVPGINVEVEWMGDSMSEVIIRQGRNITHRAPLERVGDSISIPYPVRVKPIDYGEGPTLTSVDLRVTKTK